MAKVKTIAQLEKMAQETTEALDTIADAGYVKEASVIRAFMRAADDYHAAQIKTMAEIQGTLDKQMKEQAKGRMITIPVQRPPTGSEG